MDWNIVIPLLIIVIWFVLNYFILPRFGIST